MEALTAMRLVEEDMLRISSVRARIWSTLWLFSMASSSMVMMSAVLSWITFVSSRAARSISSARSRIPVE